MCLPMHALPSLLQIQNSFFRQLPLVSCILRQARHTCVVRLPHTIHLPCNKCLLLPFFLRFVGVGAVSCWVDCNDVWPRRSCNSLLWRRRRLVSLSKYLLSISCSASFEKNLSSRQDLFCIPSPASTHLRNTWRE